MIVDPKQRIPLVHIENFMDAIVSVVTHPEMEGIFFVVDEDQPTIRDLNTLKIRHDIMRYHPWYIGKVGFWLLSMARTIYGRGADHKGQVIADYYFHTRRLCYSTEKLRTLVGWAPTKTLNDTLSDCHGSLSQVSPEC